MALPLENDELDFIDRAVKSSKQKSEVGSNLERVRFLKAYASEPHTPLETLASNLTIPQKAAENYVKKYIYLMIQTSDDTDSPRKVRLIFNEGITNPKERITDLELNALKPLVDRYGDFDTVSTLRQKELNQTLMRKAESNDFSSSMAALPNPHDFSGAHAGFSNNASPEMDKPYANLSNSGRANLLRWVLERSPYVHNSKITPFIQLFETNESKYMSSPDELYRYMCDYFGPAAGKLAFNQFKDMVNLYLPGNQGFGMNPYYGNGPQMGAPGWGNQGYGSPQQQFAGYYEQLGVIPYGVNPKSPEALRAIYEFEAEKKQRKQAEAMQEQIKNYVNMKMMDIVDPNKGGNGQQSSNMNQWMQMAMMSGQMKMQGIDPTTGQPILVPNDQSQNSLAVQMMAVMNQMWQGVMAANSQTPKFMETLLTTMFTKLNTQSDPFTMAIQAKKLSDVFNSGSGLGNGIEAAKILLARNKIESDKEMTIQKMQFDHDKDMYERQKLDKQEENSNAQTQEIVKSIFSIGGQALVPLLSMFMGKNNPGAMAAMMGGGAGPEMMMGGGGMSNGFQGSGVPQEAGIPGAMPVDVGTIMGMQQQGGNPQWMDYEPNPNFGPGTNVPPAQYIPPQPTPQDMWQNFNPDQIQYQQVQGPQQPINTGWNSAPPQNEGFNGGYAPVQNNTQPNGGGWSGQETVQEDKTNWSPEDFKGKSVDEIESELKQVTLNRQTLDSYEDAARIAHQQKLFENRNQQAPNGHDVNKQREEMGFSNMPSNTVLAPEEPPNQSSDEKLIQNSGRIGTGFDELDQGEELLKTDINDFAVLPDIKTEEQTNEEIKNRSKPAPKESVDDSADVV